MLPLYGESIEIARKSFDFFRYRRFYREVTKKPRHTGPGKKVVSIYADTAEHKRFKARAKAMNISLSAYFRHLARKDLKHPDDFKIIPDDR